MLGRKLAVLTVYTGVWTGARTDAIWRNGAGEREKRAQLDHRENSSESDSNGSSGKQNGHQTS